MWRTVYCCIDLGMSGSLKTGFGGTFGLGLGGTIGLKYLGRKALFTIRPGRQEDMLWCRLGWHMELSGNKLFMIQ